MKKIILSVLGHDRPGIIAAVSRTLFEQGCNIEDVSQTILQTEFAGFFIASVPEELSEKGLLAALCRALDPMGLSALLRRTDESPPWSAPESEPFVITTRGPDRLGLVAGITGLLAGFGINIANLKAVFRGGHDPRHNVMIYEVDIPVGTDQSEFRSALYARAKELDLDITLQHRNVFEAIHRV